MSYLKHMSVRLHFSNEIIGGILNAWKYRDRYNKRDL